ncbi:MAG: LytR/AlgR family response regulator transcription factor [Bacteroidota bacterium]|jgi:two-component system LytT family response regulator
MEYSCLIVDDEKPQQEILSGMLTSKFPSYRLEAICSSVDEGIKKIKQIKPALVFLDVQMPPKTGFDLLSSFDQINFDVIFTTSFEHFAIKAFRFSAIDYLLKPFSEEDLAIALKKFETKHAMQNSIKHVQNLLMNINQNTSDKARIALPTMSGFVFAQVNDIIRCESDNNYTTFYFADRTHLMVSKTLKDCEELLEEYHFFRVHASHLINLRYIKEYIKGDGGQVKMTDGSVVDVSRRKKDEFLLQLNKL